MNNESTLQAYTEIAPVYEEYSQNRMAYLNTVDQMVIDMIKPTMRLLDIGAGDGRRLKKIIDATGVTDIHAVEPSSGMAKICAEKTNVPVHEVIGEDLGTVDIGSFDAITALWNVFGHIPTSEGRLTTLKHMASKLNENGFIVLDVNNRHNAVAYGKMKVLGRVIIDTLNFDETRGDASYEWKIGEKTFQGAGHLFTPPEMERLFREAGLKVKRRLSVNYATGDVSPSPYKGQLFYVLER